MKIVSAALAALVLAGGPVVAQVSPVGGDTALAGQAQRCFDNYLNNTASCQSHHCTKFFVVKWCDEPYYGDCMGMAKQTYDACMGGGDAGF